MRMQTAPSLLLALLLPVVAILPAAAPRCCTPRGTFVCTGPCFVNGSVVEFSERDVLAPFGPADVFLNYTIHNTKTDFTENEVYARLPEPDCDRWTGATMARSDVASGKQTVLEDLFFSKDCSTFTKIVKGQNFPGPVVCEVSCKRDDNEQPPPGIAPAAVAVPAAEGPSSPPAANGGGSCRSDTDCSLLGSCSTTTSTCVCRSGWVGPHCEVVDVLPALADAGLQVEGSASWGAGVIHANGRWHMLSCFSTLHCDIHSYQTNTIFLHATSATPTVSETGLSRSLTPLLSFQNALLTAAAAHLEREKIAVALIVYRKSIFTHMVTWSHSNIKLGLFRRSVPNCTHRERTLQPQSRSRIRASPQV
jgi:hypothetical protein